MYQVFVMTIEIGDMFAVKKKLRWGICAHHVRGE